MLASALAARAQQAAPPIQKLASKAYKFENLPSKLNETTKSVSHAIFDGLTHSDFRVEVHETELPAGASPHPPHHHVHEEMFLLRSGELSATVNGVTTRITPGSVFYINSNEEHGVLNPGPGRAVYFVVALGKEA
jgi:mannose-6-phosphate isomerase-like protein (cupin superfamily)